MIKISKPNTDNPDNRSFFYNPNFSIISTRYGKNINISQNRDWYDFTSYLAIDASGINKSPSIIADFRKGQYAKPRILTNYRDTGALSSVGTVTAPTYNTGTGAGVAYRVDASNQSGVQFAAAANKVYELDLESGPNGIITRSGSTNITGSATHNSVTANTRQKVYLVSTGSLIFIAALGNGLTCSFTLHSIREVDTATMEVAQFNDLFTFTRAGTATYWDADGKMQIAANDVPRFDYSNGVRQLLLEGTVVNYLPFSMNLSSGDSRWLEGAAVSTGSATGMLSNSGIAPDGTNTAVKFTQRLASGGLQQQRVYISIAALTQTPQPIASYSVYLKYVNHPYVMLKTSQDNTNPTVFNIQNGTVLSGIGKIKNVGNGWYRCQIPSSALASGLGHIPWISFSNNLSQTLFVGNGTSSFLAWGWQFELNTQEPSSLIATTSASATRAADSCRLSPMAEAILQRTDASVLVQGRLASYPSGLSQGMLGQQTPSTLLYCANESTGRLLSNNAGTTIQIIEPTLFTSPVGVGLTYSATGRSVAKQGLSATNANQVAARTQVYIGRGEAGVYGNGWYDQLVVWPFRMTDAALQGKAVAYV